MSSLLHGFKVIEWLCRSYGWHVSLSIWKCVSQAHPWKGHGFFLYPALIERCILHSVLLCRACMSIVKSATSLIRVECNELPGSMAATTFPICGRKPLRFGQPLIDKKNRLGRGISMWTQKWLVVKMIELFKIIAFFEEVKWPNLLSQNWFPGGSCWGFVSPRRTPKTKKWKMDIEKHARRWTIQSIQVCYT